MLHELVVIGVDLGPARQLVHAAVGAAFILAAAAQLGGVDAVIGRRLMQRDEGVGIVPVPAGLGVPVDNRDVRIAFVEQGIGKGHTHGAAAYDEVIGFHCCSVPSW